MGTPKRKSVANRKMRDKAENKMKAKTNSVLIAVALLAYWVGLCNASAFYDPCMQRWLNRDPIGELGFRRLRGERQVVTSSTRGRGKKLNQALNEPGGPNLYGFVLNSPINYRDPLGLDPVTSMCELKRCAEKIAHEVGSDYCGANAPKQDHDLDPDCRVAHCIATCRMARECPGGGATAIAAGWWREMTNWHEDSPGDLFANREGFRISRGIESCEKACEALTGELGGM
jgi:hypothetical protein